MWQRSGTKPFPTILSWAKRKNYNLEELEYRFSTTPFEDFFAGRKNGRGGSVLVWNRLYNKAAVKGLEFPVNVQPAEDTTYTLKVLFQIKSMVSTDAEFLFYRDSSTSVMNQGKTDKYVRAHALAAQVIYEYFIKSGLAEGRRREQINRYLARFIFKSLVSQPLRLVRGQKAAAGNFGTLLNPAWRFSVRAAPISRACSAGVSIWLPNCF